MKFKSIFLTILVITSTPVLSADTSVYFTSPGKKITTRNPGYALFKLIRQSRKTFFGAFFDLDIVEISRELIRAKARGVDVRIVTDDRNFSGKAINLIVKAGIPVVCDNRSSLMHNKFAISDSKKVFTGSYNATKNGTLKNNNNAMVIESPKLARIYLEEFNEMFQDRIFSNRPPKGLYPAQSKINYIHVGGATMYPYFSPDNDIENIILEKINNAEHKIRFMYFSFTSKAVAEALIRCHKRGVNVKGLFEKRGTGSRYSQYLTMNLEGIPVRLDKNRYIMHHKVLIIDDRIVITGSYNMSKNAARRNDENILIINDRSIAKKYTGEFKRLYGK